MRTKDALLDFLAENGIAHQTVEHVAVFRVGEGESLTRLPGAHTKNLFLKDAKGQLWLVSARQDAAIDLKALPARIGSARLSFGSAERMVEALGVTPGSVTAFSLINDPEHRVRFVLDAALAEAEFVNFHPLTNTATTQVSRAGFKRFLTAVGVTPIEVEFPSLANAERATI